LKIEKINENFNHIATDDSGKIAREYIEYYGSEENITLENKIDEIWTFYECAGFDIKTEDDFCRLLRL